MDTQDITHVLALDIGMQRTGVAAANSVARLASPLTTLYGSDTLPKEIADLAAAQHAVAVAIGLPRNLSGEATAQTKIVESVAEAVKQHTAVQVYFMDEAATSKKAEAELEARKKPYRKEDIDMLSAVYILEDFMKEHPEVWRV